MHAGHLIRRTAAGLLLALLAAGCGPREASVSGTVTFNGAPLRSGTVLLHAADGTVGHGLIDDTGRYHVAAAPLGPVRVTVKAHPATPAGFPRAGAKPPVAPSPVPRRYEDPARSGLVCDIRAGDQTHDLRLVP